MPMGGGHLDAPALHMVADGFQNSPFFAVGKLNE